MRTSSLAISSTRRKQSPHRIGSDRTRINPNPSPNPNPNRPPISDRAQVMRSLSCARKLNGQCDRPMDPISMRASTLAHEKERLHFRERIRVANISYISTCHLRLDWTGRRAAFLCVDPFRFRSNGSACTRSLQSMRLGGANRKSHRWAAAKMAEPVGAKLQFSTSQSSSRLVGQPK